MHVLWARRARPRIAKAMYSVTARASQPIPDRIIGFYRLLPKLPGRSESWLERGDARASLVTPART